MADLLWPGDHRAGEVFTDAAYLEAMVAVEQAWLDALADAGIAPEPADLTSAAGPGDLAALAEGSEAGGNPVMGLVALLRERTGCRWVHRGMTSQDVVDTALVLCLRTALDRVEQDLAAQAATLGALARTHRHSVMTARTLTQHAVPTTFGLKAAGWLDGLSDATLELRRVAAALPVQSGGAAGTHAAVVQLAARAEDPVAVVRALVAGFAERLGLRDTAPWHTRRTPVTSAADALVGCADAWGRIAGDVALLSRPEIGELREGAGGGSSTMPHKANPVLSVLVRRHAIAAPPLAATLHTAAASYVDERPDGAWHAEWSTMRLLARRSVVAGSQTADLLAGLRVETERMAATAAAAHDDLRAEQRSMAELIGLEPCADYLGATTSLIDATLDRAAQVWPVPRLEH